MSSAAHGSGNPCRVAWSRGDEAPVSWKPEYTFNESRRHKIPTAKYRVTNWPEYDAALVKRGMMLHR